MLPCSSYLPRLNVKDLLCGGCSYCTRADQQWGQFIEEVDDAVPFSNWRLDCQSSNRSLRYYGQKVCADYRGMCN
ncbi:hypothetical protein DPMN_156802 [Dreissena polymorpha]|uniref:Uncharacterized protein n=1 Tax=Dreissena polymorpha TaxID=45954 RepID=A0A9D4FWA7_DREPO|nr:hypothetical protein DPMN_156802 [Dreissena polymorpha]